MADRLNRRSFLSLIAAALAIEPARLIAKALPEPDARIHEPQNWVYPYTAWDTITVTPGEATNQSTFFPPLPTGFSVRSIRWMIDADVPLADIWELLGYGRKTAAILSACADTQAFARREIGGGPLWAFGSGGFHGSSGSVNTFPVFPELRPKSQFDLRLETPALGLSRPVDVWIAIDGVVRVQA